MLRATTSSASSAIRRSYSTASTPNPSSSSSSSLPLVLALGGLGGLGAWYYLGGFGDQSSSTSSLIPKTSALSKDEFREFTLSSIKKYNHDSSTFTFKLPDGNVSGLNVASAVVCKGAGEGIKDQNGKNVIRPYTPISAPDQVGTIDFLVKVYPNGNLSKHFHELKEGDKLAIKGPIPKFPYKANEFESIGLIAGGSGITPMWQLIQQISSDPKDKTKVTLIYSNKTPEDILLKEEFDRLSSDPRFTIVYGVDKAPKNWNGFQGYLTPELGSKYLPAPGLADKIKVFVCGPPPQVEAISGGKGPKGSQGELKGILADLGYQPDQIYKF